MKQISTLVIALILVTGIARAQTTYNVTSNKNYNGNYPASCTNCTFNISNGVTLTIDRAVTLQNPVINGGTVKVEKDLTIQTSANKSSYLNNTRINVYGNNVKFNSSAPLYLTNTTITFYDKSYFNPQNLLELSNSRINFYDNSYMYATGGPVNLKQNSLLVAGDGTSSSKAYLDFGGPQLNLYGNSAIIVAGNSNYYANWSSYRAVDENRNITTTNNNKNCGSGFPNTCKQQYVYGPVNLVASGVMQGNLLPVKLGDFTARSKNNQTELIWVTEQESNTARFEVERSIDGTNWSTIATVTAKGNSSIQSKYSVTDKTPAAGINYYRLKMVDMDNTYEYSEVKSVRTEAMSNVRVYPNPATSAVNISLPASATHVRLLNTAGVVMQERKVTGNSTVSLVTSNYTAGTYMVQVISADGSSKNSALLITK